MLFCTNQFSHKNYLNSVRAFLIVVNKQLAAYVREQLHRGYSITSIKTVLAQSGYSTCDVERTLRSVRYRPVFVGVALILVLSLTVGFIFSLLSSVSENSASLSPSSPLPSPSDTQTNLKNIPSEGLITSHPQERVAQNNFRVVSHGVSSALPAIPLPDNNFRDIITLARENPHKARTLCLELRSLTDSCLLASGLGTSTSDFCIDIRDGDKRDSCYFNIVVATKAHQLCLSLTNPHLRDTCAQLA